MEELCREAQVSRASFYRHWQRAAPDAEQTELRDRLQQLALAERSYGYRRLTAQLKQEGHAVNHKRVRRLLREDNLLSVRKRRFVVTTDGRHTWRIWPNLARWKQADGPNQLWVADITYLRLRSQFCYLAVILDVWSRKVIGWALALELDTRLTLAALRQALAGRTVEAGLIHHSDRGVQYACADYVGLLEQHGIEVSMSRPGNPYDNAYCESFIGKLKQEQWDGRQYERIEDVRSVMRTILEEVYNQRRLHSALGYVSPAEFERRHAASSSQPTILRGPAGVKAALTAGLRPGLDSGWATQRSS